MQRFESLHLLHLYFLSLDIAFVLDLGFDVFSRIRGECIGGWRKFHDVLVAEFGAAQQVAQERRFGDRCSALSLQNFVNFVGGADLLLVEPFQFSSDSSLLGLELVPQCIADQAQASSSLHQAIVCIVLAE